MHAPIENITRYICELVLSCFVLREANIVLDSIGGLSLANHLPFRRPLRLRSLACAFHAQQC